MASGPVCRARVLDEMTPEQIKLVTDSFRKVVPIVLPTLESNCRTLHVGIRVLRLNRNRLIVATRHQI